MPDKNIPYTPGQVLRKPADWKNLRFYHKTDALFLLTHTFCERFLPKYGDRTVDQMVQAARSGKQNIIEGSEAGKTSTETELKLLNVARASIGELREDYRDHLNKRNLTLWQPGHPRFQPMQDFTRTHNNPEDFMIFADKWQEEEYCNYCLSLCFQVDAMINSYLKELEQTFVTEGGIKERMHKARTGFRSQQDERLKKLEDERPQLLQQITMLKAQVETLSKQLEASHQQLAENKAACTQWQTSATQWKAAYEDLKQRALKAYNDQQEEIEELKRKL